MPIFLMMYPLSVIPYSYVSSYIYTSYSSAQVWTMFFHFCTGALVVWATYVM
jgi:hypothetical protein